MEELIANNSIYISLAPLAIIIVEALKKAGMSKKFAGLYSIAIGVILSTTVLISQKGAIIEIVDDALIAGILLGGSASGIFSQLKNIKKWRFFEIVN